MILFKRKSNEHDVSIELISNCRTAKWKENRGKRRRTSNDAMYLNNFSFYFGWEVIKWSVCEWESLVSACLTSATFLWMKDNWTEAPSASRWWWWHSLFRCRLFLSAQNLTLTHIMFIFGCTIAELIHFISSHHFLVIITRFSTYVCFKANQTKAKRAHLQCYNTKKLQQKSHDLIATLFILVLFFHFHVSCWQSKKKERITPIHSECVRRIYSMRLYGRFLLLWWLYFRINVPGDSDSDSDILILPMWFCIS